MPPKAKYRAATARNYATMLRNMRSIQATAGTHMSPYNQRMIRAAKTNAGSSRLLSIPRNPVTFNTKRALGGSKGDRSLNAGYAIFPSNIPQGTAINTRERQAIKISSIDFQMHFEANWTYAPGTTLAADVFGIQECKIRVFVVRVKTSDGALSAATIYDQLFRGAGTDRVVDYSDITDGQHALMYPLNTQKYEVFYDKTFTLSPRNHQIARNVLNVSARVPINRIIQYENSFGSSSMNGVYIGYFMRSPFQDTLDLTQNFFKVAHTEVTNFTDVL